MKFLQQILIVSILFLISCGKEESFEIARSKGDFRMKTNGVDWEANKEISARFVGRILRISGLSNDNREIQFYIEDPKVGKVDFPPDDFVNLMIYRNSANVNDGNFVSLPSYVNPDNNSDEDYKGVLNITEYKPDQYISGTFSGRLLNFTTMEEVEITEGSFTRLPLTPQGQEPPIQTGQGTASWKFKNMLYNSEVSWVDMSQMGLPNEFVINLIHVGNPMNIVVFNFEVVNNSPKLLALVVNHNQGESYTTKDDPVINIEQFDFTGKKIKFTFSAELEGANGVATLSEGKVNLGY